MNKLKIVIILTLLFSNSIFAQKETSNSQNCLHRVMSCNIRVALDQDTAGGNDWQHRKSVCFEVMKKHKADIYCLQEVIYPQYMDLKKAFKDYFVFGYEGPEMDAMPDHEYHGIAKNVILFSTKRYEMTGAGTFWLAENPLKGGMLSWGTARARHVNWVRLLDKRSGKEFRVCDIHLDHISQAARLQQIKVFTDEASQYQPSFPQILCGDFNSHPQNEIITNVMKDNGWTDGYLNVNGQYAEYSAHSFKGLTYKPKKAPAQIDYIFTHGSSIKVIQSELIKDNIKGKYPSDHFFLFSVVEID